MTFVCSQESFQGHPVTLADAKAPSLNHGHHHQQSHAWEAALHAEVHPEAIARPTDFTQLYPAQ